MEADTKAGQSHSGERSIFPSVSGGVAQVACPNRPSVTAAMSTVTLTRNGEPGCGAGAEPPHTNQSPLNNRLNCRQVGVDQSVRGRLSDRGGRAGAAWCRSHIPTPRNCVLGAARG
jgi:hypothetical protein